MFTNRVTQHIRNSYFLSKGSNGLYQILQKRKKGGGSKWEATK